MSHTGTAERLSIDQPDRVSTESRDSDSPTGVQTHFRIGKYYPAITGGGMASEFVALSQKSTGEIQELIF
ncbi:MAG: hypothetical protein A2V62_06405 [Nitrospirae bacterium RBG_19FT_COMBO_58_9]|nr:MAG: hypothetical protein A2V62_06405 [Nitrospirae bacterium RBG_19FT_COMBO_58_9]